MEEIKYLEERLSQAKIELERFKRVTENYRTVRDWQSIHSQEDFIKEVGTKLYNLKKE